jgi:hypothetical protein
MSLLHCLLLHPDPHARMWKFQMQKKKQLQVSWKHWQKKKQLQEAIIMEWFRFVFG